MREEIRNSKSEIRNKFEPQQWRPERGWPNGSTYGCRETLENSYASLHFNVLRLGQRRSADAIGAGRKSRDL
jgi:hypothetical protein